jgi:hypothetical protein
MSGTWISQLFFVSFLFSHRFGVCVCVCVMGRQIDAHQSPLAAMTFSSKGMYLATASEKGTIVRVHLVAHATKVKLTP